MNETRTWTKEMDAAILQARAAGTTTSEIAESIGVSHGAIRYRLSCLRQQDGKRNAVVGSRQIKWTPEMNKVILDGRADGRNYLELAEVIGPGVSNTSIRTQFYQLTGQMSGAEIRKAAAENGIEPKVCYCCRKKFRPTQLGLRKCDYCKRNGHDQSCFDLRILTGAMPAKRKEKGSA